MQITKTKSKSYLWYIKTISSSNIHLTRNALKVTDTLKSAKNLRQSKYIKSNIFVFYVQEKPDRIASLRWCVFVSQFVYFRTFINLTRLESANNIIHLHERSYHIIHFIALIIFLWFSFHDISRYMQYSQILFAFLHVRKDIKDTKT